MARRFQFVAVSNPTEAPSSESKKSAYSHAFRQAHAKRRREQMERYRKEVIYNPPKNTLNISERAILSPWSQTLNGNKDPFSALARPLSSAEYFLLDHYVHVVVPLTVGHCGLFDYPGDHKAQLLREWVALAITDDALMVAAILLGTCRYILRAQPDNNTVFLQLALQYKQTCLRTLRHEMSHVSAPINIMTVAKAIALALDEVTIGEHNIARKHLKGVLAMVAFSGGAERIGLTGLLERMYRKFMEIFELKDSGMDVSCNEIMTQC
ncbi:hypothetical protein F5Y08DRAFT_327673 [Xylaria arbuscula]|nr:hypothetical protein F5Y08DRAFT_327673 [Xylaria arbuscula]